MGFFYIYLLTLEYGLETPKDYRSRVFTMTFNDYLTIAVLYASAIGVVIKIFQWLRSYSERREISLLEEKDLDENLAAYYQTLGEHTSSKDRFEKFTVVALRGVLNVKDENHVLNVVSRLYYVAFFAFFVLIVSRQNDISSTLNRIVEFVLLIEAFAAFIGATYLGEKIDRRIERNSLKISKYLETASKNLVDEKYK